MLSTFDVTPGTLNNVESFFSGNTSETHTRIAAWHTDVGMLNRIVHLSQLHEEEKQSVTELTKYLKPITKHIVAEEHQVLEPAPFSTCPIRANPSMCEIRVYKYESKAIEEVIQKWQRRIEDRLNLSPMLFCGYTNTNPTSNWVHIWPYTSADERSRIRAAAIDQGVWPPGAFRGLIDQQSSLVVPSLCE